MKEIKLNNNEIVQTKIYYGSVYNVETELNNWLKENTDKTIIDIKSSKGEHYLYLVVIYKTNLL